MDKLSEGRLREIQEWGGVVDEEDFDDGRSMASELLALRTENVKLRAVVDAARWELEYMVAKCGESVRGHLRLGKALSALDAEG